MIDALEKLYPDAKPALKYKNPYELLVAVVLSAQCTDERVNKVTEKLFKVADTPEKMLALTQTELERYIYSCGFYHAKAEHILSASRDIVDKFGGRVPCAREELQTLAGVGRKPPTWFTPSLSAATPSRWILTFSAWQTERD